MQPEVCSHAGELVEMLGGGAAAALVAEEALSHQHVSGLAHWLASQPSWSDLPFVLITSRGRSNLATAHKARELQALGNVTLLERPVRPETIEAAARSALRARARQYETRRRQELLTRMNTDLEQFAFTASHDLQEPIRNISIYSEILTKRYRDLLDEKGLEFLGYVNSGARRMELLIRDLLAYTKAASNGEDAPEPIAADRPLQAALLNLAEVIRQSQAELTYSSLPAVRVREFHLQQLFQNLIENAIKYRREETPRIAVSAERNDGQWVFRVQDNGIGIGPEYKERIFGLFKRLHNSDEFSGTGIGLAICQRIVDRYRGRIWVESEPGNGSAFFFSVPA
jgi:light-regulated signal transduction histidine kinase (bacteriophytochrome)